jgi:hypothetical protein
VGQKRLSPFRNRQDLKSPHHSSGHRTGLSIDHRRGNHAFIVPILRRSYRLTYIGQDLSV